MFLTHAPVIRLRRLHLREANRYGPQAIAPLGHYHAGFRTFMAWAAQYGRDDPGFTGRNLTRHRAFLATFPCPVLELDAALPAAYLIRRVLDLCVPDLCADNSLSISP